jgi:cell division protein FtsW (lipid II flippase)
MDHLRNSERGLSSVISVIQLVLHFALMFGLIIITSADLGSALVFLIIFIAIYFAGGVKLIWFNNRSRSSGLCALAVEPLLKRLSEGSTACPLFSGSC